jgi:aminoglycoside 2'-N-acetyltransferase I
VPVADVRTLTTAEVPARQLQEIRRLLVEAFAGEFSDDDWAHTCGGWHVIVLEDGVVVAHAAAVPRRLHVGERPVPSGYVEGVATAVARQRRGLGSLVMKHLAAVIHGNFEMGALSTDAPGFYARLGWEGWRGPTFVRQGADTVRTEDEDDGVMVLRFGPSAAIDLHASLACEARPGDDW